MKRDMKSEITIFFISIAILLVTSSYVVFGASLSQPIGPDRINITNTSRHQNNSDSVVLWAEAGNVTSLQIFTLRTTQAWQAYYGNITGTVVLDDAQNNTFYDWQVTDPEGEIYASNGSTVSWAKVYCMNVSQYRNTSGAGTNANEVEYYFNASQIELRYGINATDVDGLNETFFDFYSNAAGFYVGGVHINQTDGCSQAHPYTDQAYNTAWEELLLSDNLSIIFTSLIRNDANGFESGSTDLYDFQMMVLENGHTGSETTATPYYFFVELS